MRDSWLAPLIALCGAFFAGAQLRLAFLKSRQDLFDRRMKILDSIEKTLDQVSMSAERVENRHIDQLMIDRSTVKLLFPKEIEVILDELIRHSSGLDQALVGIRSRQHVGSAQEKLLDQEARHREGFLVSRQDLRNFVEPHVNLSRSVLQDLEGWFVRCLTARRRQHLRRRKKI